MNEALPVTLSPSRTVPNGVTLTRFALAGVVAWLLYVQAHQELAGILLVVASLTDWLDGYLARRLGQASLFGSLFDMLADQALFGSSLLLAMRAHLFAKAAGFIPWNPYLYAVPALAGGVAVLVGIATYLWKRRTQAIEFPTPTKVAKLNFWFWLAPLILAVLDLGPGWLLAALMYASIVSTIATFYSYLKKGGYVFTR